MTAPAFDPQLEWPMVARLAAYLAAGTLLGVLYFRALWWNAHRFAMGGRVASTVALVLGRFALLGSVLALASLEGALPLLATALGVMIGRFAVMRTLRGAAG